MLSTNTKEPQKNRHQPACEVGAGILESLFCGIGIKRVPKLVAEFRFREPEVREAIGIYNAQRSKFDGPGAVIDFLRSGVWPVDGIRSASEIQRAKAAAEARRREAARERQRIDAIKANPIGGFNAEETNILQEAGLL